MATLLLVAEDMPNKKSVSRLQHNVHTPDSVRGGGSPFTTVTYSPLSTSSKKTDPDVPSKAGQIVYTYGSAKLLKQFSWIPGSGSSGDGAPGDDNDGGTPMDDDLDHSSLLKRSKYGGRKKAISFTMTMAQFANDSCKYMFDSSYDRVMILGDRIFECGNAICRRLVLETEKSKGKGNLIGEGGGGAADSGNEANAKSELSSSVVVKEEPEGVNEMEIEEGSEICNWFNGIRVHHVDYPSTMPVRVLGRIVVESSSKGVTNTGTDSQAGANGNTTSKRNHSRLAIVDFDENTLRYTRLDLSKVQTPIGWSLFLGQTVLLEGINPRGMLLTVNQIHHERTLILPRTPFSLDKTLTMVIASAPFTDRDDLLYEKLSSLLLYCSNNAPDVLILTGPFADANCKLYAEVAETFDEYFEKIIGTIMSAVGTQTEVFVVANHDDVVSSFVYPTPPYKVASFYKNLHFLPDPCVFNLEGLEIGVTTVDVIRHLIESDCTAADVAVGGGAGGVAGTGGDKIKRAYNHLFHQASFYPLNPPPEEVPLDVDLLNEFGRLKRVPNVMICPSALNRYVREINGCVCVNPGFVDGHSTDGSYARMIVTPPDSDNAQPKQGNPAAVSAVHPSPATYIACQIVKT
uniref:DNA polymerase alpha subunit B n=1 Tax=Anopheles farauti TaxID=69004 RepID=A0A182QD18_9DIPT